MTLISQISSIFNTVQISLQNKSTPSNTYRADITGLRALAVISVLIFHIFPSYLPGGYLGVDIFFVISGFLITYLLLKEHSETGKVSLLKFYKRRLLRIAPATRFIVLIAVIFANLWLGSIDIIKVSQSAMYSAVGFANVYFNYYLETGYYAPNSALTPLLHLWSLGVEEQFYLLFPLMFLLLGKYKKIFFVLLFILFFASIVSASLMVINNQKFAYYMLPTRAFAILIGCLVAMYSFYKPLNLIKNNKRIVILNIISLLAIICVGGGLWYLKESYNLPNYLSLIVVIPTSIIILLGSSKNIVSRILGSVIFKHIGLWSFSIYLVHWLVLAIYKNVGFIPLWKPLSIKVGLIIFIVSIILGCLQYYLVEQKFRYKKWGIWKILLILIVIPFIIYVASLYRGHILFVKVKDMYPSKVEEQRFLLTGEPNVFLIGDSNASHYYPALMKIANKVGFKIRFLWVNRFCFAKLMDTEPIEPNNKGECNMDTVSLLQTIKQYDIIIFSHLNADSKDITLAYDTAINSKLKDTKLFLILGEIVKYDTLDTQYIAKDNVWWFRKDTTFLNKDYYDRIIKYNKIHRKALSEKYSNVYYLDFNDILCKPNCVYQDGINSLYYNNSHLSLFGSNYIGEKYLERGKIDPIFYKIKKLYKEKKGYLLQVNEKTKRYSIEKTKTP